MAHKKTTMAYGVIESNHKYVLEDFSDFSRNHTKARSIRNWKRGLKSKARQASRRNLQLAMNGCYDD